MDTKIKSIRARKDLQMINQSLDQKARDDARTADVSIWVPCTLSACWKLKDHKKIYKTSQTLRTKTKEFWAFWAFF